MDGQSCQSAWLTTAAGNISRYAAILNDGIRTADPIKVYRGADSLTSMNKYILDVDLHHPDVQSQINLALDGIHTAGMPIINSIDSFDPANLAEAKRALQEVI